MKGNERAAVLEGLGLGWDSVPAEDFRQQLAEEVKPMLSRQHAVRLGYDGIKGVDTLVREVLEDAARDAGVQILGVNDLTNNGQLDPSRVGKRAVLVLDADTVSPAQANVILAVSEHNNIPVIVLSTSPDYSAALRNRGASLVAFYPLPASQEKMKLSAAFAGGSTNYALTCTQDGDLKVQREQKPRPVAPATPTPPPSAPLNIADFLKRRETPKTPGAPTL